MFTFFYKSEFYKNHEAQNGQNKNNTEINNLYIPQVFHSFFIFIEQYSYKILINLELLEVKRRSESTQIDIRTLT